MYIMKKSIAIVGAGFSGAVIAHELAKAGHTVNVFDGRSHVAGNCHTERHSDTNIMIHKYGPHIFHTNNKLIWDYVNSFDYFVPFTNRVKSVYNGKVYTLPINLLTINNFFGKAFGPQQAKNFIESIADNSIKSPANFEEQALKYIGKDLYEAFFKGYTMKQWGISPRLLPAHILSRLPIRFNYDDNYYSSRFQGIPKNGYTYIIEKMLDHPNISVSLNDIFDRDDAGNFNHVFYSGPIDSWFKHSYGRLGYRTLDFEIETHNGDYQGNPVINYSNIETQFTRISEHKHFAPWEEHDKTVIYKEYSRGCGVHDIPYYPIRLVDDKSILSRYIELANKEMHVTFVGRLGTYRYLDMHVTIEEAILVADKFKKIILLNEKMPAFCVNPI